ncbi:hypothetical protein ASPZODRAFT_137559 [Penicilliopsis zonata CBS 506.65]|uniref:DUF3752 domain-containing protein n=1 Tax=Penicilliopsis zonata CBS 506.65 TaxID=1073090 RepID=A0A1L9S4F3_9EURO|nr:hypothetical protein ASPZODRAFT_137559 [Penicilliopsis zonata CBS 506.65]OJJ42029.1 hypothetical protein ASPZODRAFT_137559 [Penicilliopsis zonata CBS 506.65]
MPLTMVESGKRKSINHTGNESEGEEPHMKKPKSIGPTLPSHYTAGDPRNDIIPPDVQSTESESDDDIGPGLPTQDTVASGYPFSEYQVKEIEESSSIQKQGSHATSQRDHWMLHPPDSADKYPRADKLHLRNRGFVITKSGRAHGDQNDGARMWTETTQQKMERLENQVMGVSATAPARRRAKVVGSASKNHAPTKKPGLHDAPVQKYLQEQPGTVSSEDGKKGSNTDRIKGEKSRAVPRKVGSTQQSEQSYKAAGFASYFSKGGDL